MPTASLGAGRGGKFNGQQKKACRNLGLGITWDPVSPFCSLLNNTRTSSLFWESSFYVTGQPEKQVVRETDCAARCPPESSSSASSSWQLAPTPTPTFSAHHEWLQTQRMSALTQVIQTTTLWQTLTEVGLKRTRGNVLYTISNYTESCRLREFGQRCMLTWFCLRFNLIGQWWRYGITRVQLLHQGERFEHSCCRAETNMLPPGRILLGLPDWTRLETGFTLPFVSTKMAHKGLCTSSTTVAGAVISLRFDD